MKFSLLLLATCALIVSCERHEFEGPNGTKQLHEHGHAAHDDKHDAHGEAGHEHDDHEHEHTEEAPKPAH